MESFFHPFSEEFTMGEKNCLDAFRRLHQVYPQRKLSARLYEYFITQYAQDQECIQNGIDIGKDYNLEWKKHTKKNFNFFRRGKNIITIPSPSEYRSYDYKTLQLTEPFLRFLDWVAKRQIDIYINENMDDILEKRAQQNQIDKNAPPKRVLTRNARSKLIDDDTEIDEITKGLTELTMLTTTPKRKKVYDQCEWWFPPEGKNYFEIRIFG